ncbi:MAG: hypothetical protein ACOC0H_05495 [Thermodesulfobacteriota bacterium]
MGKETIPEAMRIAADDHGFPVQLTGDAARGLKEYDSGLEKKRVLSSGVWAGSEIMPGNGIMF